jgi:hypothetical protein
LRADDPGSGSEGKKRMKIRGLVVLLAMGGAVATAAAKNRKDAQLPPLFCQARSVYVQTVSGDPQRPEVVPQDRAAANALIEQLQSWKHYVVVTNPQQADLIWVVRAGRTATQGAGSDGGLGSNRGSANQDASGMGASPNSPGMSRGGQGGMNGAGGQGGAGGSGSMSPGGSTSPGDGMGADASGNRGAAGSSAGAPDDILAIFQRPDGGPLAAPLWQRNQRNGLESPKMALFEQIRTAVEASCAAPATAAQTATPPQ